MNKPRPFFVCRSNPYFAGPDNANVQTMKEILLNFAFFCPQMGYNQVPISSAKIFFLTTDNQ